MRTTTTTVALLALWVAPLASQHRPSEPRPHLDAQRHALDARHPALEARHIALDAHRLAREEALAVRHIERAERAEARARHRGGAHLGEFAASAPEPWLVQDPADSLYRAAREALNARRWEAAARDFERIRQRYPRSGYVGDSYYFQALALYRQSGAARLDRARALLAEQQQAWPDAATRSDARELTVRIDSELARRGSARAAQEVARSASAACEDEEEGLRATALSALLHMDAEQAEPILREVLRERGECSAELRKRAVFLLSQKMSEGTVDLLVDLAHRNPDPDPEVREAAVFWLSQVHDERAMDALLGILRSSDVDPELRERAIFAVGQHRSERGAQVLRDYARDASAPSELRGHAIFWLGQRRGAEGDAFLRELYPTLRDPELKERVLFSVSQKRTDANRDWLLARARDASEDTEVRKKALFWAGQAGLSPAQAMQIYGSSTDVEMKEQVLFVLSQVREQRTEAVDALMEIARTEENRELRERAVFWLGQSKDPRVAEFLLQLIRGGG